MVLRGGSPGNAGGGKDNVKYGYISLIAIASVVACVAPVSSESESDSVKSAVSSSGLTATFTLSGKNPNTYFMGVDVQNNSAEPVSNWQIGVSFNTGSLIAGQVNGAAATRVANQTFFTPLNYNASIPAHGTTHFSFNGNPTGSNWMPTLTSVDGVAPGTAYAGEKADGVDHIAQVVATYALNIAEKYEKDKKPNNGDANYALYDRLIWSAHSYRLASGNQTIEFDPNVPGYAFIADSAKAELLFAQLDPSVATYLTTGLASCFNDVTSTWVYAFRADFLKGSPSWPTSGSLANADKSVDTFDTRLGNQNGLTVIKLHAHSGPSNPDSWFGILTYNSLSQFGSTTVGNKFSGPYQASCSPFHGPGGAANPMLVIRNDNVNNVPARYQQGGQNGCQNNGGCDGNMVLDPTGYLVASDVYDPNGVLMGTQANPFQLVQSAKLADPYHQGNWSTYFPAGVQEWGTFSQAVTIGGSTKYRYVKQY
jgi:hypothetical protein